MGRGWESPSFVRVAKDIASNGERVTSRLSKIDEILMPSQRPILFRKNLLEVERAIYSS
jgi:hypothetical protein